MYPSFEGLVLKCLTGKVFLKPKTSRLKNMATSVHFQSHGGVLRAQVLWAESGASILLRHRKVSRMMLQGFKGLYHTIPI